MRGEDTLNEIIAFYSNMVGQAAKHSLCCQGIFTGITRFMCTTTSSLNNMVSVGILDDKYLFPFYGVTLQELNKTSRRSKHFRRNSKYEEFCHFLLSTAIVREYTGSRRNLLPLCFHLK